METQNNKPKSLILYQEFSRVFLKAFGRAHFNVFDKTYKEKGFAKLGGKRIFVHPDTMDDIKRRLKEIIKKGDAKQKEAAQKVLGEFWPENLPEKSNS